MRSPCFAEFGKRSAARRVMLPQQCLETKGCEKHRERDSASWYRIDGRYIPSLPTQYQLEPHKAVAEVGGGSFKIGNL